MRKIEEFRIEFASKQNEIAPAGKCAKAVYDIMDSFKGAVLAAFIIFSLALMSSFPVPSGIMVSTVFI